ncbi:MAG: endolytic transglycosylase MltG [Gemmatimonadota bacterium]
MRTIAIAGGVVVVAALGIALVARGGGDRVSGNVQIEVPEGASAVGIGMLLQDSNLVRFPRLFGLVARWRGTAGDLKAGRYVIPGDATWTEILDVLERGVVETVPFTIPEGYSARQVADVVAELTHTLPDSVLALINDSSFVTEASVPGPGLEGYLFPETYRVAEGLAAEDVVRLLVSSYQGFWNPERRALLEASGRTEREVVTLASIVEKEARVVSEMPTIAGVYENRLRIGMLLQADPTVQFALGSPRSPLLFAHIDSVADNPYNTYTHAGLPPGPIASPGTAALEAALQPADVPYLYFVARNDGTHEFSRTLREHNNARMRIRRDAARAEREAASATPVDSAAGG